MRALRGFLCRSPQQPDAAGGVNSDRPASVVRVEILTESGEESLEIEDPRRRMTDVLNGEDILTGRRLTDEGEVPSPAAKWEVIDIDSLLVVVPPEHSTDSRQRLHRPGHPVRLRVGPYLVEGLAHVPPGAQATAFLQRHGPRFVALTRATITAVDRDRPAKSVRVAIINLRQAESLAEDSGL